MLKNLTLLLFIGVILFGCKAPNNPEIYKPGRKWVFAVSRNDQPTRDTIILRTNNLASDIGVESSWRFRSYYPSGKVRLTKSSDFKLIELNIEEPADMFFDPFIELSPPDLINDSITLLPHPKVILPVEKGWIDEDYSHKTGKIIRSTEYSPEGDTISDGPGEPEFWENLEVAGSLRATGRVLYKSSAIEDSCRAIEATGRSSVGKFEALYYFHEETGFVMFEYRFPHGTLRLDLVSAEY
jgi:hypothetical protein